MNGRITIVKRTSECIGGRKKTTESEFYSCWCEIQDLNTTEKYNALQIKLEDTIVFKVRICRKVEEIRCHLKEFFIRYNGGEFEIYAASPMYTDDRKMLLKCNRIS